MSSGDVAPDGVFSLIYSPSPLDLDKVDGRLNLAHSWRAAYGSNSFLYIVLYGFANNQCCIHASCRFYTVDTFHSLVIMMTNKTETLKGYQYKAYF